MCKIKLQKIVGNLLDKFRKLYMNQEICSCRQVKENSRQYLLLRTDILQKTVVGCPCLLNESQDEIIVTCLLHF